MSVYHIENKQHKRLSLTHMPGGAVVIPSQIDGVPVRHIGASAFNNKSSLTSVTIPNTVTSIGDGAFSNCRSLTSVTIPNSVTSIERDTFNYCISLTSVTIPNSVISIGYNAFLSCRLLNSIIIPDSVTSIVQFAFNDCPLSSVYFTGDAPFMGAGVFAEYVVRDSQNIDPVSHVIYYKSSSIGFTNPWNGSSSAPYDYILSYDGNGNTSGSVPTDIKGYLSGESVSVSANSGNLSRTGCIFDRWNTKPDGTGTDYVAGTGTFNIDADTTLYAIWIPFTFDAGTGTITGYTGSGETVVIPSKIGGVAVTSIANSAFANCTSILNITIPASVTVVGNEVFSGCTSLESAYFYGNAPAFGSNVFDSVAPGFKIYYCPTNQIMI